MPDDPAALVVLAVLLLGLASSQPLDSGLHRAELLIAAHHLHRAAVDLLVDGEVADQVEQERRAEHPRDQLVLAGERGLVQLDEHVGERNRRSVLPLQVVHSLGADGANARLVIARRDEKLVGIEEPLGAFGLLDLARVFAGIVITAELVDGVESGSEMVGLLHSTTTTGMPLMKSVMSGRSRALCHPAGAVDCELAHRRERVPLGMIPVDELDGLARP